MRLPLVVGWAELLWSLGLLLPKDFMIIFASNVGDGFSLDANDD